MDTPDSDIRLPAELPSFNRRNLLLAVVAAALFLFVWYQAKLLFLIFAGFLFAVALQTCAAWIERHTPLTRKISYTVTLIILGGLIALAIVLIAPRTIRESAQIATIIPKSLDQARHYLEQRRWGGYVVNIVHQATSGPTTAKQVTGLAMKLIDGITGLVVIAVVGFFAALSPVMYTRALILLLPPKHQQRAKSVGADVIHTLRWWLAGQITTMVTLGAITMIGLSLMGVPLAFTLGLFTGVMIFIPYIGAILSEIPAVLVALTVGPMTAVYVLIFYLGIHTLEGYILTPFIQRKAVRLPPLLTIVAQLVMWELGGFAGVIIATPLAAVVLVLVKTVYLKEQIRP